MMQRWAADPTLYAGDKRTSFCRICSKAEKARTPGVVVICLRYYLELVWDNSCSGKRVTGTIFLFFPAGGLSFFVSLSCLYFLSNGMRVSAGAMAMLIGRCGATFFSSGCRFRVDKPAVCYALL